MGNKPLASAFMILAVGVTAVVIRFSKGPLVQPDGVLAPNPPHQSSVHPDDRQSIEIRDWVVTTLAEYSVNARVLARKDYELDATANLAKTDLVLGWGAMSDNRNLEDLKISQNHRWYVVEGEQTELSEADINSLSANTHIIPATVRVQRAVDEIKPGMIVEAAGYLVQCESPVAEPWISSLVRGDSGAGACEIFYVEAIRVLGRPDENGVPAVITETGPLNRIKQPEEKPSRTAPEPPQLAAATRVGMTPAEAHTRTLTTSSSSAAPRRVYEITPNAAIEQFLSEIAINGVGPRGAVINGQFARLNRVIDEETGLKLVAVESRTLTFEDNTGNSYVKKFR